MNTADIRKQVLAQIIAVMAEADAHGRDTVEAAKAAFPGTPEDVLWSAWVEFEAAKTEAWWRQVEHTIDVELVRKAIAAGGAK